MLTRFWQWLGASFAFAAIPFLLKGLMLWSYGEPTGFFTILGNGDLALAASILSSSALLDLYLIDKRETADKVGFFIVTVVVALIAIGYYAGVSKAFPNPRGRRHVCDIGVGLCVPAGDYFQLV